MLVVLLSIVVAGCANYGPATVEVNQGSPTDDNESVLFVPTAFQPVRSSPTPDEVSIWVSPALPPALQQSALELERIGGRNVFLAEDSSSAEIRIEPNAERPLTSWVYALVAPFPTVRDEMSWQNLEELWSGNLDSDEPLFISEGIGETLQALFTAPKGECVENIEADELLERVWENRPAYAVIGFEDLEPRWKVIEIASMSPIQKGFDPNSYPLVISFGISGKEEFTDEIATALDWPATNRDPDSLTVLTMTGVTALTRATAWRMDAKGSDYPGLLIGDWLRDADITHVSNEVSFAEDCPQPDPAQKGLKFCSSPRHFDLLPYVGVDVVELTGNHILDWGRDAFLNSLSLYEQQGYEYFGGGKDLAEALQPALFEHNDNHLAFLGCNQAGPSFVWATSETPGGAPCSQEDLFDEVKHLRAAGYLPIFTYQWAESYSSSPLPLQIDGFHKAIDAGAVIVSGSQAHQPQGFEFYNGGLIHYGLGNLFFDQMWNSNAREEFIDQHVFYNGRHISTRLLTAVLEDWSQPRPMSPAEREAFLAKMFAASGW